jgi:hypothetical protein
MKLTLATILSSLMLCIPAWAKSVAFHVTSYKYDYLGDKPTQEDCSKTICTLAITTVEGLTPNLNPKLLNHFVLQCKSWLHINEPKTPASFGKCRTLRVGADYEMTLDGNRVLFSGDKADQTDPFFLIIEEAEIRK